MRLGDCMIRVTFFFTLLIVVFLNALTSKDNLLAKELSYSFIVDSTFYYKTNEQSIIRTDFNFNEPKELKNFPLNFGKWQGEEFLVENLPVIKPDFMFEREYRNKKGGSVWFQLIRGRIERAVHVPSICYYNAGWQIIEQDIETVKVGKYNIPCGKMLVKKGDIYANELYFYLWQDPKRDFMKGCVMFRIASLGRDNGSEERLVLIKEFVKDIFNEVR